MAAIDVSDLLSDPDFTDVVSIITVSSVVNQYGENELSEEVRDEAVVIQPADAEVLSRLPDGARLSDSIFVYSRSRLNPQSVGGYADVILINRRRYQVLELDEDYMNYGRGFTKALCVMEDLSAQ